MNRNERRDHDGIRTAGSPQREVIFTLASDLQLPDQHPILPHTLTSLALTRLFTMAMNNDASSPPIQSSPSHQVSIIDVFIPGFTGTSVAIQQLLAGNLNRYAQLLCVSGVLAFFGRHAYKYLVELAGFVGNYFST